MDSMRSLNTSLPGTSPAKQVNEPPEQILQAFKAAALSVTKLYQTAAADQGRARSEGYQDALDDLLAFLDKEDIGLSDGEGWRIRRWATERLDGRESQTVESEDETGDKAADHDGGSSPEIHRSHSATRLSSAARATRTASPARAESLAPPTTNTPPSDSANTVPPAGAFTFQSTQQYPDSDVILSDIPNDSSERRESHSSNPSTITITRPRANQRHGSSHSTRQNSRATSSLGRGAGQKRKVTIGDVAEYFDFSNFGNGKDTFGGGGKRGRFV